MAEDIQTRGCMHCRGHGPRVERIADTQRRLQIPMSDSRFRLLGNQVENGRASGLRTGSSCRWNGHKRFQFLGYREAFAQRRVDEIEKVRLGIDSVEIHQFRGINDRSAAYYNIMSMALAHRVDSGKLTHSKESIRIIRLDKFNSLLDPIFPPSEYSFFNKNKQMLDWGNSRAILRLNPHFIKHRKLDPLPAQPLYSLLHSIQLTHIRIRNYTNLIHAQILKIHPHLLRSSRSEADARSGHFKGVLLLPRSVNGGRQMTSDMVCQGRSLTMMVVMIGVRMARTVWGMRVLDCSEEIESSVCGRRGDADRGGSYHGDGYAGKNRCWIWGWDYGED